jgi:PAS domain S-box-containing protein
MPCGIIEGSALDSAIHSTLDAVPMKYGRVWTILALSIALVIIMGLFLSRSLATLNDGSAWVAHTERVRFQLAQILQSMSDLGNGVTGYQITHDPRIFEPAEVAAGRIDSEMEDLTVLVSQDKGQRPLVLELGALVRDRERDTQEQRERALRGDNAAIDAEIATGGARRMMDATRAVIGKMQREEKRLLDYHSEAARSAYNAVAIAIWGTSGIAVFLLVSLTMISLRDADRLRALQEELATTLRSVGDAVIATDGQGRVRFINLVAEQLTGWANEDARGLPLQRVFAIFNEQTRAEVESPVSRVLRENQVVGLANHTILRARDGTERPIEDSGAPIRGANGEITGVVLVFRDATEDRAARRELIESRDALREADRRKDVFLATLSHELRNPLAPIRSATRVLETPGLTQLDLERSRSIISRQVRHMATLLDDLLDISRITRGMLTLRIDNVEVRSLMEAAVETAQPSITAKRHTLHVEWPSGPILLNADPLRLTQVIANLLTNAAKYTPAGGQITLRALRESDQVVIGVRDNGIGIAPGMLAKVFEMFSQIDAGQEHAEGGIGIGLALVKGFVELHGGAAEARSAGLDQGSEFIIRLPVNAALHPALEQPSQAPEIAPEPAAAAEPEPPSATAERRVLVADDNRDGAEIMALLLQQYGYEVSVAHSGPDALTVAAQIQPDIAILDIGMPGMNGYEVAQRIRAEGWGKAMMLIALTGWGQEEDKKKAFDAGFDHHLIKPIDPDALEALMASEARAPA